MTHHTPLKRADIGLPVTRRTFATSAAALLCLAPVAGLTAARDDDSILPLYREWLNSINAWRSLCLISECNNPDTPEMEALWARKVAACAAMVGLVPVSPEGIAALCHVLWDEHLGSPHATWTNDFAEECEEPQNLLVCGIWAAATRQGIAEAQTLFQASRYLEWKA